MYDKIKLVLDERYLPEDYNWKDVLNGTERYSSYDRKIGGKGWWRGRLVTATETEVTFEGSLPKCLWDHNLKSLSLNEVKDIIMRLDEDLGIPMHLATVKSVEFAHNFIMNESPLLYIEKLGGIKKFRPNSWSGTKYMENDKIRLKFYDKMKEAKRKRELPKYQKNELPPNLLRYEVSFNEKGLNNIFSKEVIAEDLWSKRVFWRLAAEWFGCYEDVEKLPTGCWDVKFSDFKNAKDFDKWLVCIVNSDQNLPYYVKHVLFGLRENPDPNGRVLHEYMQKRIKAGLEWGKVHLTAPDLTLELTKKIEEYLTYLLEQSQDGMTVEEERRAFDVAY